MDVGTKDLRKHLSEILDRVERGERVRVLRRGKPAAALTPITRQAKRFPSLAEFRARIKVKGKPLSEEVIAARRASRY